MQVQTEPQQHPLSRVLMANKMVIIDEIEDAEKKLYRHIFMLLLIIVISQIALFAPKVCTDSSNDYYKDKQFELLLYLIVSLTIDLWTKIAVIIKCDFYIKIIGNNLISVDQKEKYFDVFERILRISIQQGENFNFKKILPLVIFTTHSCFTCFLYLLDNMNLVVLIMYLLYNVRHINCVFIGMYFSVSSIFFTYFIFVFTQILGFQLLFSRKNYYRNVIHPVFISNYDQQVNAMNFETLLKEGKTQNATLSNLMQIQDLMEDKECSICLTEYLQTDEIIFLHCSKLNHFFHKECLLSWLKSNKMNQCPLCRSNIMDDSEFAQGNQGTTQLTSNISQSNLTQNASDIRIAQQHNPNNSRDLQSNDNESEEIEESEYTDQTSQQFDTYSQQFAFNRTRNQRPSNQPSINPSQRQSQQPSINQSKNQSQQASNNPSQKQSKNASQQQSKNQSKQQSPRVNKNYYLGDNGQQQQKQIIKRPEILIQHADQNENNMSEISVEEQSQLSQYMDASNIKINKFSRNLDDGNLDVENSDLQDHSIEIQ